MFPDYVARRFQLKHETDDAGTMPFEESYIGGHSTATVTIPSVSPTSAIANEDLPPGDLQRVVGIVSKQKDDGASGLVLEFG